MKKKIIFLTGTRADYGKLKSLILILDKSELFDVHIFVTGMHMNPKYGGTVNEISKSGFKNIFMFYNHYDYDTMDTILSKTIDGFSSYVKDIKPDLIIIHGDRPEALAGAIVGSFNNILTAHIEGGEVSGTIDESIRHSASKMCHVHFVSNEEAKKRLIQLGEHENTIFIIGSPDLDIMLSDKLPSLKKVKKHYDIEFEEYAILMFHTITTEAEYVRKYAENVVNATIDSNHNYVVIFPNNDIGSDFIISEYSRLKKLSNFKVFSSLRFEYFLVLLQNAEFIIGNSSAGIREAPYYGVPTVNIGTRQQGRVSNPDVINSGYEKDEILDAIHIAQKMKIQKKSDFGVGNSDKLFLKILKNNDFWNVNKQKRFIDL